MAEQHSKNKAMLPWLALAGGLAFAVCQWVIFCYAPVEKTEGMIQKIFYMHLPLAWWGLISFFVVFIGSIMYLRKRSIFWDELNEAAAEVGLILAGLALVTGSIWARVSWNTWWTWDPRLSTTLIMWFIYAGYLIVRKMDMPRGRIGVISAVIGIVAFIDVPLVFFSTRLWPQSIHPTVVGKGGGGMPAKMLITMLVSLACFGIFWVALLAFRTRLGLQKSKLEAINTERALND